MTGCALPIPAQGRRFQPALRCLGLVSMLQSFYSLYNVGARKHRRPVLNELISVVWRELCAVFATPQSHDQQMACPVCNQTVRARKHPESSPEAGRGKKAGKHRNERMRRRDHLRKSHGLLFCDVCNTRVHRDILAEHQAACGKSPERESLRIVHVIVCATRSCSIVLGHAPLVILIDDMQCLYVQCC